MVVYSGKIRNRNKNPAYHPAHMQACETIPDHVAVQIFKGRMTCTSHSTYVWRFLSLSRKDVECTNKAVNRTAIPQDKYNSYTPDELARVEGHATKNGSAKASLSFLIER